LAIRYEQATEAYLAKALENSADVVIDSPNRDKSRLLLGTWHLRNFDGLLIARVAKEGVRLAAPSTAKR